MDIKSGYFYALATVSFWAMYNIIGKFSLTFGINPAIYVCVGLIVASAVLFRVSGPGELSLETFKQPRTTLFSILNILEQTFTLYMFLYISAAEGSLMQRMNIAIGLLIAFVFLKRAPSKKDLLGTFIILIGVFIVMYQLSPEYKNIAIFWLILATLAQTLKTFLIETHPQSNKAEGFKNQARVTAIVSFVTSVGFLVFMLIGSVFKFYINDSNLLVIFPNIQDFIHPATFFAGCIFGLINEAPSIYCYFVAIKKVKTEKFLAFAALVPVLTLLGEYILSTLNLLEFKPFSLIGYVAIVLIFIGSIIMSLKLDAFRFIFLRLKKS